MKNQKGQIDAILKNLKFNALTDVQNEVLEKRQESKNILLLSPTGSGKTLAFLLPLALSLDNKMSGVQCLILAPTRELALQISNVFKEMKTGFQSTVCYGGHSLQIEKNNLSVAPSVIIGTPGRITDHISRGNIELKHVQHLIIDEYDKCLELGFEEQLSYILGAMNNIQSTTLVSATELESIPAYFPFSQYETVNFLHQETQLNLTYWKLTVDKETETRQMASLLSSFKGEPTLVFCNFRETTEYLQEEMEKFAVESIVYHGGLEQEERERALIKFRNGSVSTLICTDLGSRGLDIPDIQNVVHFQYPQTRDAYVHRNGRTARMKSDGNIYLLIDKKATLPDYIDAPKNEVQLNNRIYAFESPWITLYFSAGKKDKINKIDLVGFLTQKGELKKEEIGLITVRDHSSYVAVSRKKVKETLNKIRIHKVKGKKLRIAISK